MSIPLLLSVAPFIIFLTLLLLGKTSLLKASVWALLSFTFLAVLYWKILPEFLVGSYQKGFFVALDIFIIIFGAIFFLDILEDLKIIKNISYYLEAFSKDYRIQVVILAWFFENFLEGTAGFGTPVAIVVPLLVGLGLTPMRSLVVGLLGNSAAGVFGAAGTPIRVGYSGLDTSAVPMSAALINCVGLVVPAFMLWIITSGRKERRKEFLEALPFAIWSGIAFVVPSVLFVPFGQEFPTILGSVAGLLLVLATTKLGIFIPKDMRSLREEKLERTMSAKKAFSPYVLLIILLIAGKLIVGNAGVEVPGAIKHAFSFFNPGFVFIVAGFAVAAVWKSRKQVLAISAGRALKDAIRPFLVIVAMSAMVQLMIYSGNNSTGFPAALAYLSRSFETSFLPFFAPFIGAFGSFMTGSVTISDIMFGNFFASAAGALGMKAGIILSLGVVGAAAGNMIALADMLAAEAVVGVKHQERQILRGVFAPCLVYLLLVGLVGMFLI
jgi:lactate permease